MKASTSKGNILLHAGMLIAGLGVGGLAIVGFQLLSSNHTLEPTNVSSDQEAVSVADLDPVEIAKREQVAIRAQLDSVAHPDDPQTPAGVTGLSDAELSQLNSDAVKKLIEDTYDYAQANKPTARFNFALGRLAFIHGDEEFASELLTDAATHGSAAANMYLAQLTDDGDEALQLLQKAVDGGFEAARPLFSQVQEEMVRREEEAEREQAEMLAQQKAREEARRLDFNQFALPSVVKRLHSGETASLAADQPMMYLAYVSSLSETVADPSMLYLLQNSRQFIKEVDPRLHAQAGRKFMTNSAVVNQATTTGMNSLMGFFGAIADVRRRGGTIQEEVAASNRALLGGGNSSGNSGGSYHSLHEMKEMGARDGRILALMYDERPEDFRKIYAGMKQFVYRDL